MIGNRLFTGINNLCKWVCYFFYLNVMWMLCTLLGGVLLGISPSTVALYTIARKTAMGEEDIPVFKTFWRIYKKEFLKANLLGLTLIAFAAVWYMDFIFFRQLEGTFYRMMDYFLLLIGILFVIVISYIFPVYVHYEMKFLSYMKYSIAFGFLHPLHFIAMIITTISTYYFFAYFQGFILILGFSLSAHLNMWLAYQSFQKIAEKHLKYEQKTSYNSVNRKPLEMRGTFVTKS
ncbi:YesL family protein [Aquibacillus albus]|uniref:Membrane protein YesL n=1 Tax=Aquibacillus albus TaxID=1168171 RepID=A0ABS2N5K4_9BACI|nr:YesL family protein [Aquibacillus albus]MBM7573393.1 putative membrane protein YesL [Aquibacillus albus]